METTTSLDDTSTIHPQEACVKKRRKGETGFDSDDSDWTPIDSSPERRRPRKRTCLSYFETNPASPFIGPILSHDMHPSSPATYSPKKPAFDRSTAIFVKPRFNRIRKPKVTPKGPPKGPPKRESTPQPLNECNPPSSQ